MPKSVRELIRPEGLKLPEAAYTYYFSRDAFFERPDGAKFRVYFYDYVTMKGVDLLRRSIYEGML